MSDPVEGVRPEATAVPASLTPTTPAPTGGQAPATDPSKAGASTNAPGTAEAGKADTKPPEIKDEDLDSRLFSRNKPEETIESLRRDYAASSKEAIRLNKAFAKLKEQLAEQQIEVAEEDGIPVGLLPGKNYSKEAKDLAIKFSELSEAEQGLFGDNPQKAIELVLSRAKKALVRVAPTLDSFTKSISAEREQAAIEHVKGLQEDGESKHPAFEKNIPFIKRMLDSKQSPKGLKDAYNQSPEFVLELLSRFVDSERATLLKMATKELSKKNNPSSPPLGPSSGATPVTKDGKPVDPRVKAMAEAMGNQSL